MENKVWKKIDSQNLVNGSTFEGCKISIRAMVFGAMVELARDRVKHYRSDLYHDAIWINETLTGPMEFEWVARESGTHIGDVCQHIKDDDWSNSARYRFDIREERSQKWVLDTYQSVPYESPSYWEGGRCSLCGNGNHIGECYQDNSTGFTDVDYSENEAYQLQEEKNVRWTDSHAALDISECDVAFTAAGCIFHPAPVNGWTTQDHLINGTLEENPTLRNETIRKVETMESIIRDLREKFEEAESTKDQLEEFKDSIDEAVNDLETYLSDLDDLISSLDSLPEVSIYVDLDTVSFDS